MLDPLEVDACLDTIKGQSLSDREVAESFVASQRLTPFQAGCILRARTIGLTIGSYRLLSPINFGGIGEIFAGRDSRDGTLVALKLLKRSLRYRRKSVLRFELETFALSQISHCNVISLREVGWVSSTLRPFPYLVTELVSGPSIDELISIRGRIPYEQACDLMMQAAMGADAAHRAGFLHRDIKPGNLLVSATGQVKLIDFGLCHYAGSDKEALERFAFSHSNCCGTPRFSAPEQFHRGTTSATQVSAAADVYSLASTFLCALSGKSLCQDSPIAADVCAREILSERCPGLPEPLVDAVTRGLKSEPRERIQSASEFAEILRPFARRFLVEINFDSLLRARQQAHIRDRRSPSSVASTSCTLPSIAQAETKTFDTAYTPNASNNTSNAESDSVDNRSAEIEQLRTELASTIAELDSVRRKVEEHKLELKAIKAAVMLQRSQFASHVKELRSRAESLGLELRLKQFNFSELEQKHRQTTDALKNSISHRDKLAQTLSQYQADYADSMRLVCELEVQQRASLKQHSITEEQRVAAVKESGDLASALREQASVIQSLTSQFTQAEQHRSELSQTVCHLKKRVNSLRQLNAADRRHHIRESASLRKQIAALTKSLQETESLISQQTHAAVFDQPQSLFELDQDLSWFDEIVSTHRQPI